MNKAFQSITLLSLVIFLFGRCSVPANEKAKEDSLQVKGYRVLPQPFQNELITTANIMANEQVELKAPIAGQVIAIHFKEGQSVREGEMLVQLDDRSWQAEMIGVKAELEAAEKDLKRKKALLDIGGSSQLELDQATSMVETLKSQIQQLKVNIDLARVTAPFSGQLGMRNFSKGAFLNQGDIISTLSEISQLKIDFSISQTYRNSIDVGTKVWLLVGSDSLEAVVYAINPVIDPQTRTVNARAMLKQREKSVIMPGTFAEVLITTNYLDDAILIPTQAVVQSINEQTVYISKKGKAVRKVIKMGNRTADKVHVLNGISVGDTILTTGLLSVKEGMDLTFQKVN